MSEDMMCFGSRVVLIAPHPDDVAYSIGGLAAKLARYTTLELVTVFARSAWAVPRALRHAGFKTITAVRQKEDLNFCHRLGMRLHTLDFADSSLSGYDAVSERESRYSNDPRPARVLESLSRLLTNVAPDMVLAPAAIGGHVDHRIVRDVVRRMNVRNWRIAFYEDLPYAAEFSLASLTAALQRDGLRPLRTVNIDTTFNIKLAALWDYQSQTEHDTADAVVRHAKRLAATLPRPAPCYVERIWEQA